MYEAATIQSNEPTTDISCSNAASVLQNTQPIHTQHKPSSSEPTDIAPGPAFSPVQPVGIKLPKTTFGNRTRSFNPVWYKNYEWLEYSVTLFLLSMSIIWFPQWSIL